MELTKTLKSITSKQQLLKFFQDGEFDFTYWAGTWEFNKSTQGWDHSTSPSNQIIIKFPHPYSSATNNAVFTYYDYTTTQTLGGSLMTGLKAKLELDGTKIWDWEFKGSYSLTAINIQTTTNSGAFTVADEMEFTSSNETTWGMMAQFTVKKNGSQVFKVYNKATYKVNSDQSTEATVEAKVTVKSIEFRYKLTFKSTDVYNYYNLDPNNFITMSVWTTSDAKVADLYYKKNTSTQDWELWIKFTNGSEALAETYLGEMLGEVDLFWDLFYIEQGGY